jgi:ring-1,2-phenylacetyl-CoA epoxidase subunit PaaD
VVTQGDILRVLQTIDDPEMPISIVDLGLVEKVELRTSQDGMDVSVEILPTFVGCTALPVIESEIQRRVSALAGVVRVNVTISYSPAWSVDRITAAGRESLRRHGVTVPQAGEDGTINAPVCPFCGSSHVRQESAFGPTRCRAIWYCKSCRQPFEHLKRLGSGSLIDLSLQRLPG